MTSHLTSFARMAVIAALLVTAVGGHAVALCGADLAGGGCCCGTAPGSSPCGGGADAGATSVCCAPASPAPAPTVVQAPQQVETAALAPASPASLPSAPAVPARTVDRSRIAERPAPELFTLHAAFLI